MKNLDLDKYSNLPKASFNLDGKIAILTGATGRLGPEICRGLLHAGAKLVIVGRSLQKLEYLANELDPQKRLVSCYSVDLFKPKKIRKFIEQFSKENEKLDILINNAYSGLTNSLEESTDKQYMDAYKVSVIAAAELTKGLLPKLRAAVKINGDASVINLASMYGMVSPDPRIYGDSGQNSPPYYSTAKAGLIHYSNYSAVHLAKERIRVNSISPGPFPDLSIRDKNLDFYNSLISRVPMGRIGVPEDLVGPIVFLSSSSARFVTGTNLVVDGGWTAW